MASELQPIQTFADKASHLAGLPITSCFAKIFENQIIHVPKYQRKYCWKEAQWSLYFSDALANKSNHRIGRLIFYPHQQKAQHKVCVDGQQRITTAMVLLATVRDWCSQLNQESNYTHQFFAQLERKINSIIFVDAEKAEQVMKQMQLACGDITFHQQLLPELQGYEVDSQQPNNSLSLLRFIPSLDDRRAFFYTMLNLTPPPSSISDNIELVNNVFDSHIEEARKYFKKRIATDIVEFAQQQNLAVADNSIKINKILVHCSAQLNKLVEGLLNKFIFTEFILNSEHVSEQSSYEALSTINWVNSLLMQNNRPGIHLNSVDLVRNFCVAKGYSALWKQYEELFEKPLPLMLVEQCIIGYVKHKQQEKQAKAKSDNVWPPKDLVGPLPMLPCYSLYGDFVQIVMDQEKISIKEQEEPNKHVSIILKELYTWTVTNKQNVNQQQQQQK